MYNKMIHSPSHNSTLLYKNPYLHYPKMSLCATNLPPNVYHPRIPAKSLSERREAYNHIMYTLNIMRPNFLTSLTRNILPRYSIVFVRVRYQPVSQQPTYKSLVRASMCACENIISLRCSMKTRTIASHWIQTGPSQWIVPFVLKSCVRMSQSHWRYHSIAVTITIII